MADKEPIREIKVTGDGSHTLYLPEMEEHYHSHFGALTESEYIFINTGLRYCKGDKLRILEVGFGTGLNALLTAIEAGEGKKFIHYYSIEKYPLASKVIASLNYGELIGKSAVALFRSIHSAPWNKPVNVTDFFTLEKVKGDMTTDALPGIFDLVYFDAFGPDKQPEMWSDDIFHRIALASRPGTVFVTYSAKGRLKRTLLANGFDVEHLPGPPGKRCITRAIKR
ncbi:MAG TPA: tRNA (5-methylaminomethyl-2-thiouridine)(34)-methyltransferase MnmD [Bacteroidales bacterium]|nr:tRNA (5-methylaminomethyl-2-thiouridine)(34)-methyltransferase MnmD [Bacteroidales bacterium]HPT12332.1 tRNA (5-methylaminomethyl-2-thiouridine)(34)-methyltransferase MnmD [Bacteroidales bacterium]